MSDGLQITHVVCTENFAGCERYVAEVAVGLTRVGCGVRVIGGDRVRMTEVLRQASVEHLPASSVIGATRALVCSPQPDVIHVHMTKAETAATLARLRRPQTPVVTTRHFAARRGASVPARAWARVLGVTMTRQIAISDFVARAVEGSTTTVLNAVADRPESPVERDRVIFVAQRLDTEKDGATAIRAWAASGLADHGWRLEWAGTGALRDNLTRLASQLGVSDSITWLGHVSDVGERLDRCGIFLATAPAEPFGLSVAEAMSAGAPVVAAAGGGHLETVGAVTRDWMFPPGDAGTCALHLQALAADLVSRRRYGSALRQQQRDHLRLDSHVRSLLRIYEEVVR